MPPRAGVRLEGESSFVGGLNLNANPFELQPGESPSMMNVDVDPLGGVERRGAVGYVHNSLGAAGVNLWSYWNSSTTRQLLALAGTTVRYGTGTGNWTTGYTYATAPSKVRAVTFTNNNYWVAGDRAAVRWNGTTATTLGTTFNDNLAAPTNGNMPRADLIAAWGGYTWVASTWESGTNYGNRVRFSHANRAEDWRTNDYIDIDTGRDGDVITAIVPMADRLLVFKNRSLHAIYGYDSSTFQVVQIADRAGTPSQESTTVTEYGVYFWSWPDGVMQYTGNQVRWVFGRLQALIEDGTISGSSSDKIALGWLRRRLWVSYPDSGSSVNTKTLVFDPALGRDGGWMRYNFGCTAFHQWTRSATDAYYLGLSASTQFVLKFHQSGDTDDFGAGAVKIASSFSTRWFDGGSSAIRKRYRRPEFVLAGDKNSRIRVEVFRDYDPTAVTRTFYVTTDDLASATWNSAPWGTLVYASGQTGSREIDRGSSLGPARSVQLRFTQDTSASPFTSSTRWGLSSIALKYKPKRIR